MPNSGERPLGTREEMRKALRRLLAPLAPYYSVGGARLRLGGSGAGHSASVAELEGFSRVLWGLAPLLAGGGDDPLWDIVLRGIVSGTDPDHAEYWGLPGDYDQRLVEMAAFGFALAAVPERIWTPLSAPRRERLREWLDAINRRPVHDCNWLFFPVLVNLGFRKLGLPHDAEGMERNLRRIDEFALDGGWYADGIGGHSDYYTPFAFHYFRLLYAGLAEREEPARARRHKAEALAFARDFVRWFSADGSAIPYGRSLSYRFAQSAFWSALAYAGAYDDDVAPGVAKGIVMRNLRWWLRQPIFRPDGALGIGYAYVNPVMAENYNSPGSPYWALQAFLPLALPENDPFWAAEERPLPPLPAFGEQRHPSLVVVRQAGDGAGGNDGTAASGGAAADHIAAFNAGHGSAIEHTHAAAKYEKFVYSARFGFSVPRAEWGLAQGAYDSALALSERDNLYRVRRRCEERAIGGNILYSRWKPWRDVEVRTWLLAGLPWHIRVHRIENGRPLSAAEGGFSLPAEDDPEIERRRDWAFASGSAGTSGIVGIRGFGEAELVRPQANTNLLHPRTVLPTLKAELPEGEHWLISAVCGHTGAKEPGAVPYPEQAGSLIRAALPDFPGGSFGEAIRRMLAEGMAKLLQADDSPFV
ncbi:DUF2264 domain-containing protein [Paenibacillaceae bacterium WGS1546]|uniref:DUF2264 domain-containing protein n=1 Tax=Cohnella sp. WGS1546 TaxID=3366810 RepID=UPI00372D3584